MYVRLATSRLRWGRSWRVGTLVGTLVVLAPASAFSRDSGTLSLAADAGLGGYGGSFTSTLHAGLDVREGNLAIGVFGRLRLMPAGDDQERLIRSRDFDEVSDFVHLLRDFSYRHSFGGAQLRLRAGELFGTTLGHGTLLRDYSNIADPDHLHAGIRVDLEHERFDIAALIDNFVRPSVVATRVGVRPLANIERLTLGSSLVLDTRAPRTIQVDEQGLRSVDDAFNLQADTELLALMGLDAEFRIGNPADGQVVPYADFNTSFRGVGLHAGVHGRLPLGQTGVDLLGQAEYRLTSGGYAPAYVSTMYDVERYQAGLAFDDAASAAPEQRDTMLGNLERRSFGGHGVLAQLGVESGDLVQLKLGYRYHPGPDAHRAWMRLATCPVQRLALGTLIMLRGIGQAQRGIAGMAALAEGRYRIFDHMYVLAQYSRIWSLDAGTRYYGFVQSFNFAVGGNWSD